MKKAYMLAIGGGYVGAETWTPEIDKTLLARINVGQPTDEDFAKIPENQALEIGGVFKGRVPEILGMSTGPFVLAPALKEFLELNEPGIHRFLPIQIKTRQASKGQSEFGTHWFLAPPPKVDCLNLENTVMTHDIQGEKWDRIKNDDELWGGGVPFGDDLPCMLEREPIEGRHLWRAMQGSDSWEYTCSDEFWKFFKSNKMVGWTIHKTCDVA